MRKVCLSASLLLLVLALTISTVLAVPGTINYQGKLTGSDGTPLNGTYQMTFGLYDSLTGGTVLWTEVQNVTVTDGIYNVNLGSETPLSETLFDNDSLFLEVTILNPVTEEEEIFTPRQKLTSTAFAMKAADSETLSGHTAAELDQSDHVSRTDNPHGVTAAQVGAVATSDFTWSNLGGIPSDIADGDQVGITTETDPTVPADIKDGISWSEVKDIPDGFSDGIDNDSGGDITSVEAGTGLTGGGETGDVSLRVNVPLNLSGTTSGATVGIIEGTNTGNGYGVKGYSSSNYGIYGYSSAATAIFGYSSNNAGASGINGSTGNEGKLGTGNSGAYGKGATTESVGVKGEHSPTGNNGSLGSSISGVYGYAKGTASGVYGTNENGNYAYIGGVMYSLYASASVANSWAGYFLGKTTVANGKLEINNSSGENWVSCLRGTNQNGGISWNETNGDGSPETLWIFPFFRGWESDNLIVRDEAAKKDVMTFQASTGKVGIGTVPETLLHVSSGTSGDAILLLEADKDNNNENDQPAIELRQDGGAVTAFIGFGEGENELKVKSTDSIEFFTGSTGEQQLATSIDTDGNLHVSGNVQIDGTLTVTHHSFVSIPPAAFMPLSDGFYDGVIYSVERVQLMPNGVGGVSIPSYLYAPVNLPHGAEIVKITCWWEDNVSHVDADYDPHLKLYRCSLNSGVKELMASLRSHWNDSDRHLQYAPDQSSDYASDSIEHKVIDNYQYNYTLFLYLPKADDDNNFCALGGVRIEYKYNP